MKIKNIGKSSFSCKLAGYDKGVITLKPGEVATGIPVSCHRGLKGLTTLIMLCWENDIEKPILQRLSRFYYTVGEFNGTVVEPTPVKESKPAEGGKPSEEPPKNDEPEEMVETETTEESSEESEPVSEEDTEEPSEDKSSEDDVE